MERYLGDEASKFGRVLNALLENLDVFIGGGDVG